MRRSLYGLVAAALVAGLTSTAACASFRSVDTDHAPNAPDGEASAAASDAFPPAEGGEDGAIDAPPRPSGCTFDGGVFCDDFETPVLDSRWTLTAQSSATATLAASQAHTGKQSLDVAVMTATASNARIAFPVSPPAEALYLRLWVRVPSSGWVDNDGAELAALVNELPAARISIIAMITAGMVTIDFLSQQKNISTRAMGVVTFPLDSWKCLRVRLEGARTSLLDSSASSPTEAMPLVSSVSVGLAWTGTSVGFAKREAFFDDIAISSADPGCP